MNFTNLILFTAIAGSLAAARAGAEALVIEMHSTAELAKGECADPNMTDEERSERISRSLESAEACMGHEWAYGGLKLVQKASTGQLDIDADISANRVRVTDRDGQLHTFLASPGRPGGETDTYTGDFQGPFRVEGENYTVQSKDKDYFGAPMPWAVFYHGGYAIHGTYDTKHLGQPASHGCIRVAKSNAAFINSQVRMGNDSSVSLHVYGQASFNGRSVRAPQRRRSEPQYEEPYEDPDSVPYSRRQPPVYIDPNDLPGYGQDSY